MNRKEKIKLVQRIVRYLANSLLILSIIFLFLGLYYVGPEVFNEIQFWITMIALWQVVIMLILVENFYIPKK